MQRATQILRTLPRSRIAKALLSTSLLASSCSGDASPSIESASLDAIEIGDSVRLDLKGRNLCAIRFESPSPSLHFLDPFWDEESCESASVVVVVEPAAEAGRTQVIAASPEGSASLPLTLREPPRRNPAGSSTPIRESDSDQAASSPDPPSRPQGGPEDADADSSPSQSCLHRGRPHRGALENDGLLPRSGRGFYHSRGSDRPGSDNAGCDDYVLQRLRTVGAALEEVGAGAMRMGVLDISRPGGGPFRNPATGRKEHRSHQNGLDVDVRYLRKDRRSQPLNLKWDASSYDREASQQLVELFLLLGAEVVFVDDRSDLVDPQDLGRVRVLSGHHHHFHVRFPNPDQGG